MNFDIFPVILILFIDLYMGEMVNHDLIVDEKAH